MNSHIRYKKAQAARIVAAKNRHGRFWTQLRIRMILDIARAKISMISATPATDAVQRVKKCTAMAQTVADAMRACNEAVSETASALQSFQESIAQACSKHQQ